MLETEKQNGLTKVLVTGLFLISVAVMTGGLTDPVNVPKLLLLGVTASVLFGLMFSFKINLQRLNVIPVVSILVIFLSFAGIAVVRSNSPISQNIYGAYGRNNGFVAYF